MKKERLDREKKERALKIMQALSGVDEELLERSEESRIRENAPVFLWRYARSWAAVLCLAVVGIAGWGGYRLAQGAGKDMNNSGAACDSMAQIEDIEVAMEDDGFQQAPEVEMEGAALQEAEENISGGSDIFSNAMTDGEKEADISAAEPPFGEMGISAARQPSEEVKDTENAEEKSNDNVNREDEHIKDEACAAPNLQSLTEQEARGQETLGGYVPAAFPRGYSFESASRDLDRQEENLRLCWTRGMDSIMISLVKTDNLPATVDVEKPETYDERMYSIPYADSVPEEYRQSVNDPVFARADLTLEMIRSRMLTYNDSGDTDTPRGNFSVLCSDGVLVRFSGRGTAEEIWEMFCSMEDF